MSRYVEKEGKTVEEAIDLALAELGIELEDADVEILDEGSKGVLGLFGTKVSKVRVTANVSDEKVVRNFLEKLIETMGIEAEIKIKETRDEINVDIFGENVGALIGKHGDTLYSLSYLLKLMVNKGREDYKRVIVDVENYRKQREEVLIGMANRAAARVAKYKRPVSLAPMPACERRVIHAALQTNPNVESVSQGEEPDRCVVVRIKPYTKVF
ncbi:MAG: protein jag [Clostridia bacterium]|nr:protein jag [Clostridia bacterium]